jgi:hypothetical protein
MSERLERSDVREVGESDVKEVGEVREVGNQRVR